MSPRGNEIRWEREPPRMAANQTAERQTVRGGSTVARAEPYRDALIVCLQSLLDRCTYGRNLGTIREECGAPRGGSPMRAPVRFSTWTIAHDEPTPPAKI